ncbi:hypothetical protein NSZ01_05770 [Nocardioides szechwanensis]|nr:hypothetical protein NSZ01_05770 [Nocardioides szechwanensis]
MVNNSLTLSNIAGTAAYETPVLVAMTRARSEQTLAKVRYRRTDWGRGGS